MPLESEARGAPAVTEYQSPLETAAAPSEAGERSLLDHLLATPAPSRRKPDERNWLTEILSCQSPADLAKRLFAGRRVGSRSAARQLDAAVARLDSLLAGQVNAILHHARFQSLEASWRGLEFLWRRAREETDRAEERSMEQADAPGEGARIILRVLPVSKRELWDDASTATEFDQTELWKKVYEAEFGTAGGTPFGMLIGDYEFRNHPDDLDTLASISAVAAASFAPFIAAAAPQFFGLDDFQRLELGLSLEQDFQQPDYLKWRSLRASEDARFLGLTIPRVLMRRPHRLDVSRDDGFRFVEEVAEEKGRSRYLWGNAAYAFGGVVLRAYAETGWFADIRGFERGQESGGLVAGMTSDSFSTDRDGIALKPSTDVVIRTDQWPPLSELGFIPLCSCQGTEFSAFYSNASVHKPGKFDAPDAATTARMSAMLQYVLCASRFAHYMKTLCRESIGSYKTAEDLHKKLNDWITRYVADDPTANADTKARFPLRRAEINVNEIPGKPGAYRMEMLLLPHYQLDALSGSLRLVHRLPGATK